MRSTLLLLAATSTLATTLLAAPPAPGPFDGKTWWKHVQVLADDNMEGRETGSPGLRKINPDQSVAGVNYTLIIRGE